MSLRNIKCVQKGKKPAVVIYLTFVIKYKVKTKSQAVSVTVDPLIKDTLNKVHNTFNFSIKDKFFGPYRTMAIQFYLCKIVPKLVVPKVSIIQRFYCIIILL